MMAGSGPLLPPVYSANVCSEAMGCCWNRPAAEITPNEPDLGNASDRERPARKGQNLLLSLTKTRH